MDNNSRTKEPPERLKRDSKKSVKKDEDCDSGSSRESLPCSTNSSSGHRKKGTVHNAEDDDYLLEVLHNLKSFLNRVGRWLTCYAQFCYPGLRTVDYYRRVKESAVHKKSEKGESKDENSSIKKKLEECQRKLKECQKKKLPSPIVNDATEEEDGEVIRTAQKEYVPLSTEDQGAKMKTESSQSAAPKLQKNTTAPEKAGKLSVKNSLAPAATNSAASKIETAMTLQESGSNQFTNTPIGNTVEEMGEEQRSGFFNRLIQTFNSNYVDGGEGNEVMDLLKLACVILVPATLLLGARYIILRHRYKRLSGWLKGIKRQNGSLRKETSQLENLILTTEQAMLHFKKSTNKKEVLAQFTTVSENIMAYKKEIAKMTSERAALIKELKAAKSKKTHLRMESRHSSSGGSINRGIVT